MRKLFVLLMVSMLCLIFTSGALAAPKVILNGKAISFDVPPVVEDGRVLVPLRAIFTALHAEVSYDNATQVITANKKGTVIKLTLGKQAAFVGDKKITLSVPAKAIKGRTLVPLRFVSESLGATVDYDGKTKTITIKSNVEINSTPVENNQTKENTVNKGQNDNPADNTSNSATTEPGQTMTSDTPTIKELSRDNGLTPGTEVLVVELTDGNFSNYDIFLGSMKFTSANKKFAAEVPAGTPISALKVVKK